MTVVVGTAGHIDHGKTTLLRALTGIDADRLPEERRRGMTIDVGYAHLTLSDGRTIDFVDVPGHDRLVGNMLVGAGEIDAALLVIAADDGPRAQTSEHLALLDALGVAPGIVVVTKTDAVAADRVADVVAQVRRLLVPTSLAGSPVITASAATGEGLDDVRAALVSLVALVDATQGPASRPPALAIDRIFGVKGRGVVATGTLRGGPLARGDRLRVVPGADDEVRVREIQVHGSAVERVDGGGRTALNLVGPGTDRLHRGVVLTADPTIAATDRFLAAFWAPVADRSRGRIHAGTEAADAVVGRSGYDALVLPDGTSAGTVRLDVPLAARPGDRFVIRRGPGGRPIGGTVLETHPPRGISRRRQTPDRVASLRSGAPGARLDLHGAIVEGGRAHLADDVTAAGAAIATAATADGAPSATVRSRTAAGLRRLVTLRRDDAAVAAAAVLDRLVESGRLTRDGDVVRPAGAAPTAVDPAVAAAMDRLEAALAVPMPPPLGETARAIGCPPDGVRALERAGRIVIVDADLAYAMRTYQGLTARALRLATREPLTPAALRDATGTSRKYVMAILEDLDRRALLRRTPAGHVPGPKAPAAVRAAGPRDP